MTLRATIFTRCTTGGHAGLSALIGLRCYPDRLPENVTYPAVVYHLISADNSAYRTHDGATTREVSRVQFDCYAETGDGAAAVGDQVRAAWDGYSDGCTIGYAWQANRIMTHEDGLKAWRAIVDIMIEHSV
jgi:hypothetical protein